MRHSVTASLTAQNTFTGWAKISGIYHLMISGIADSTVTFQGSPDDGVTIYDLDTFNAVTDNTLHIGTASGAGWVYRAGIKTGDYGTDTVVLRLED
jgi:hypothetical protein